jgi:superkiller protein 3
VNALRRFPTFASAFTSIGIYYLEQASPPDFDRAQRCFQKAFELDATQAEAARRLVMGLAEEKEWALVDVIAKRVIAGEGGLEGGLSGTGSDTTRFLPTNAWAWKAVGGVEMVSLIVSGVLPKRPLTTPVQSYRKYAAAAQAYQIALRVDSEDASLWMRLGEAYAKAGRQAASIKTLQHALVLEPDNWVCNYHMGEVQRQLGLYNEAITSFQHILDVRPEEVGAAIALAECALELGKSERRAGLMARSQASVSRSIECMGGVLRTSRQYRLVGWRVFAEACLELFHTCREDDDVASSLTLVLPLVEILRTEDEDNRAVVAGVTSPAALVAADPHRQSLLLAAICAYAYRADLLKYDKKVSEPPLYDLATALHIMALHLPEDGTHPDQREACIKAATLALKRALDSDPSSPSLWNAFGTVASLGSAQLAQHAFVVSLELEPRVSFTVFC